MAFVSDFDKKFFHMEGEVLVFQLNQKFTIFKIILVEKVLLSKGKTYNIAGHPITAPEDDFFLCIPINISKTQFDSFNDAVNSLKMNEVDWVLQMSPMRPSGIYSDPILKTNVFIKVSPEEIEAYHLWKKDFLSGNAGVW